MADVLNRTMRKNVSWSPRAMRAFLGLHPSASVSKTVARKQFKQSLLERHGFALEYCDKEQSIGRPFHLLLSPGWVKVSPAVAPLIEARKKQVEGRIASAVRFLADVQRVLPLLANPVRKATVAFLSSVDDTARSYAALLAGPGWMNRARVRTTKRGYVIGSGE
jgi:hypothetical protein